MPGAVDFGIANDGECAGRESRITPWLSVAQGQESRSGRSPGLASRESGARRLPNWFHCELPSVCPHERYVHAGGRADAKGKGASGSNREAESTDAPERDGLPRSSDEAAVMAVERRGWVIAVDLGQLVRREEPFVQRKAAAFVRWHEPDDARVSRPDL
jgi:hypothetical protein